jgi:hypothetical protein
MKKLKGFMTTKSGEDEMLCHDVSANLGSSPQLSLTRSEY